ncbi:hypothetical protein [Paenibacillus sp. L3-i20]|uniref:hypothetical protein n=1 Tax=Paenibacillus sp. L3-i20 TaxID=2905833 RepID=UPI001EDE67D7|nr:hypothetical protein [Paenibacillus sp. L3-i20]GKU75648.1 hypothetical protein L3i20_v200450 [Paenibacillus sp. L3-i20]
MQYNKTEWKDHIVDNQGNVVQQGTPLSAGNLNNMEKGIADAHQQMNNQQQNINRKVNLITTDQASGANVEVKGRTLVNLINNAGTWQENGTTHTQNGLTEMKTVLNKAGNGTSFRTLFINPNKHYLLMADMKNETAIQMYFYIDGGGVISQYGGPGTDKKSVFEPINAKISPAELKGSDHINIHVHVQGSIGQFGFIDNLRVYEISASDYAKINVDPEHKGAMLAEKYPYVDGVQHLQGVSFRKRGKNLLPPFTEWGYVHPNAKIMGPYKLTTEATKDNQNSDIGVNALPNTVYSFSGESSHFDANYVIAESDVDGKWIRQFNVGLSSSFTTGSTTHYLRVIAVTPFAGSFTFTNPQLELGSVVTPFAPQNNDYINVPTILASNVDRSIADGYDSGSGQVFKRWRTGVKLDGMLPWSLANGFIGYKSLFLPISKLPVNPMSTVVHGDGSTSAIRFDGKIVPNGDTNRFADKQYIHGIDKNFYLSISNADSGWSDALNPSSNAVNAILNGWKATANNGSVYTSWISILTGLAPPTNTEAYVSTNKAPNWDAWATLDYMLATPIIEQLVGDIGAITFHTGGNMVELLEGVVVRELANPVYYPEYKMQVINCIIDSGSFLKNKTTKFLAVYRNGELDDKWHTVYGVGGNGGAYTEIKMADYDPKAKYSVTYEVLDKHTYTASAIDATLTYQSSIGGAFAQAVQDIAEIKSHDGVQDWILAQYAARLLALEVV